MGERTVSVDNQSSRDMVPTCGILYYHNNCVICLTVFTSTQLHVHCRLWDFISQREEDSLALPRPPEELWDDSINTINTTSTTTTSTTDPTDDDELPSFVQRELFGDRSWFWMTYEPDEEDIDF